MSSEMIVDVCADLRPGDRIEARHHGRRQHRGTVTETIPGMGLVWILEETLSERKLLDMSDVQIVRIQPRPAADAAEDGTEWAPGRVPTPEPAPAPADKDVGGTTPADAPDCQPASVT